MPHFKLPCTRLGAVVDMLALVSDARRGALQAAGADVPAAYPVRMLIDTGASLTTLDPLVLQALHLVRVGTVDVFTPSTGNRPHSADTFDVALALGAKQGDAPLYLSTWKVVSAAMFASQGLHGLLGRDFLSRCVLNYNGSTAEFTLAY